MRALRKARRRNVCRESTDETTQAPQPYPSDLLLSDSLLFAITCRKRPIWRILVSKLFRETSARSGRLDADADADEEEEDKDVDWKSPCHVALRDLLVEMGSKYVLSATKLLLE